MTLSPHFLDALEQELKAAYLKGKAEGTNYDRIIRVAKLEERDRLCGIIDMYIGELGDTNAERVAIHMLELCKKTIEGSVIQLDQKFFEKGGT